MASSQDHLAFFDEAKQREDKGKTLALLAKLNSRLAEINNGTFEVEDLEGCAGAIMP